MKKDAILDGMLYLPVEGGYAFAPSGASYKIDDLKRELTVRVPKDLDSDELVSVEAFSYEDGGGYFGVPRAYAMKHVLGFYGDEEGAISRDRLSRVRGLVVNTTRGTPLQGQIPTTISPRDDKQKEFFSALLAVVTDDDARMNDCVVNASTGSGKTVSALWLAGKLQRKTLVVVHNNTIKEQWLGSVKNKNGMRFFFGEDYVTERVGVIQQDKCDYGRKDICVAMLPSLARRDYGEDFYAQFGLVIYDECHKAGANLLSEVLKHFPAETRLGITATNRRGPSSKLVEWHLGTPVLKSKQKLITPVVYRIPIESYTRYKQGLSFSIMLNVIAKNDKRNSCIAQVVKQAFDHGRHILVLSDRVDQLQTIATKLEGLGVPKAAVGVYVDSMYTDDYVWSVKKDGKLVEKGVDSTKESATRKAKEVQSREVRRLGSTATRHRVSYDVQRAKVKVSKQELDRIKTECQIIEATYGIFDTGSDVPRLSFGVEASPRGNVVQAIGRITREKEGKPTPVWVTIDDRLLHVVDQGAGVRYVENRDTKSRAQSRMRSFKEQGVTSVVDASPGLLAKILAKTQEEVMS